MDDLPVDLGNIQPIPLQKSLLLINNFSSNTARFLNHFAKICDDKLTDVTLKIDSLDTLLTILETKLNSIPGLENFTEPAEGEVNASTLPDADTTTATVTSDATPTVASTPDVTAAPVPDPVPAPALAPAPPAAPQMTMSQHPDYAKYFKLVSFGVPEGQIHLKIASDGLDPNMFMLGPDAPVPDHLATAPLPTAADDDIGSDDDDFD